MRVISKIPLTDLKIYPSCLKLCNFIEHWDFDLIYLLEELHPLKSVY